MTSSMWFFPRNHSLVHKALLVLVLLSPTPALSLGGEATVVAVDPVSFKHAGILDVWSAYAGKLTFGKGQTLALLDDGCKLSMPEWSQAGGPAPKVLATWNSVDGNDDPKHVGRGYHGSTIGMPSSLNYKGKRGVAFNNQLAVVRALECCHCNLKDSKSLAAGLQWVIDNHAKHRITAVKLAPVDDLEHATPVSTEIDARLKRLRELGIWVSAPAGNHNFIKGISWPACQPHCFAIGAVRPGKDEVYLDRSAKIDLVVPAAATSSSNAILCGSVLLLREAIDKAKYDWKKDGANLPDAMLAILQRTGVAVRDPGTNLTFRRLNLKAALDEVFQAAAQAPVPELLKREVSREGIDYLQKLNKRTPFGTNDFNLTALRTGMGSRRLPTIKDVKLIKVKIGEIPGEWVLAPGADPEVRLLYIHGGGFVSGSGAFYLAQTAHISAAAKCAVLLPDYRLAPEHRFPAGLDDCVLAHQWMLANGPGGPAPARATFVAGDSAGGSLTLATLLALRDRKMTLPAGGIAISPCTDFTLASESLKTVHDPIISARTMPVFRDHYLGKTNPKNPLASPVFGDYRGLPPLLIQAGEHEMLRDDSIRVAKKARADGIAVQLEVWPGMFHVFQSHEPLLPEAREAIAHLAEFMRSAMPRK